MVTPASGSGYQLRVGAPDALPVSVVLTPQQSVIGLMHQAASGQSLGAPASLLALGASVMGLFSWSNIWIYLLADFAGGAAAALAFRYLNPDDLDRADPHLHLAVHASDASHPSS
jgi:hypothetical protein